MKLTNLLNEGPEGIPSGHYVATSSFNLSPGGGWRMGFSKDKVYRYDNRNSKLEYWDSIKNEWMPKAPPISGTTTFNPLTFGGGRGMVSNFLQNTKKVSESQAKKLIKSAVKEKTLKVKDAEKFLNTLDKNATIKITLQ